MSRKPDLLSRIGTALRESAEEGASKAFIEAARARGVDEATLARMIKTGELGQRVADMTGAGLGNLLDQVFVASGVAVPSPVRTFARSTTEGAVSRVVEEILRPVRPPRRKRLGGKR